MRMFIPHVSATREAGPGPDPDQTAAVPAAVGQALRQRSAVAQSRGMMRRIEPAEDNLHVSEMAGRIGLKPHIVASTQ